MKRPRKDITHLYHGLALAAGGVDHDVVAGHADDALDAVAVREDGDLVDDEVADADAAAVAVQLRDQDQLVHDLERRQHRGPHGRADAEAVFPHEVRHREHLGRADQVPPRLAQDVLDEGRAEWHGEGGKAETIMQ